MTNQEQYELICEKAKKYDRLVGVLYKIRAEIEQTVSRYSISRERGCIGQVEWSDRLIKESEVLQIIDKYMAESEDKCKNCKYYRNPDYTRCHKCKAESEG